VLFASITYDVEFAPRSRVSAGAQWSLDENHGLPRCLRLELSCASLPAEIADLKAPGGIVLR
jgi:hypothetical protein